MTNLVVLPSFNEKENIVELIERLLALPAEPHICVVDDSSPDGTAAVIESQIRLHASWRGRVNLIKRSGKGGRGSAVRDGLAWGFGTFERFVEMDCDLSHDPDDITVGLALIDRGWDMAVGSRYPDGEIVGWPWSRRIFSRAANLLARTLISWEVPDYTNGYRFYSSRAVNALLTEPQRNTGFIYLSESLAVLLRLGLTVTSFPIVFRNREKGNSNTNLAEISSALIGILDVARWYHRKRS